jgi:UDP-N-acetylglucosamine acyltransferase
LTTIGSNNLIMAYCHVGHDCVLESQIVLANSVHLAGHVSIQDHAILGGTAAVHQFTRIGERVMVAGGAIVVQDVPPFCLVQGDRARISGLNVVGLRRSDLPKDRVSDIKSMFKILYNENLTVQDAIERIGNEVPPSEQRTRFIDFLKQSERGICR